MQGRTECITSQLIRLMEQIVERRYKRIRIRERNRQILKLRYEKDYTYRQISKVLPITHQTAKCVDDQVKQLIIPEVKGTLLKEIRQRLKAVMPTKEISGEIEQACGENLGHNWRTLILELLNYQIVKLNQTCYYADSTVLDRVNQCHQTVQKIVEKLENNQTIDVREMVDEIDLAIIEVLLNHHKKVIRAGAYQYQLNPKNSTSQVEKLNLCYGLLKKAGKPLHTSTILEQLELPENLYDYFHNLIDTDTEQRFRLIGKTGYIGLAEWNICGKSIKDAMIEILETTKEEITAKELQSQLEARKQIPIKLHTVISVINSHKHLFHVQQGKVYLTK